MLKNMPPSGDAVSSQTAGEIDDVMVKDPFCEVYFPKRKGLHLRAGGEDLYFCSPECKGKYIEARSKK
jgi:YHS domain-containing protein